MGPVYQSAARGLWLPPGISCSRLPKPLSRVAVQDGRHGETKMEEIVTELRKFLAPEFIFGTDARRLVGRYARKLGANRVLLASDPGVAAAGWTGEVTALLEAEGLAVTPFLDISPNPRDFQVMAGAELLPGERQRLHRGRGRRQRHGLRQGHRHRGHQRRLHPGLRRRRPGAGPHAAADLHPHHRAAPPPTSSQFAIITNSAERVKIAIISKTMVPDVALIDPGTLLTMDPYLTACTGMDALVHAIEAYVSNAHSPITDLHALEAIRLVATHLQASVAQPESYELRSQIMLASLQAGLAFSNASLGCVHAMAHSLGGLQGSAPRRVQRPAAAPCHGLQLPRGPRTLPAHRRGPGRRLPRPDANGTCRTKLIQHGPGPPRRLRYRGRPRSPGRAAATS